ncbi:sigma 54-interacting transcriptional regulator [Methylicorpusculum sp.]|uniref:sigma 54-interacting transcriptional regulator n=1 Tax=Methylicorpusculum sp. TaxID=2713644 RepID=UPI0027256ADF|nr:sigma 54-interacting transcriptional regulator [Methylicorpusculum sp.]MDO8844181.1 sigma 54-interacting transcriptional regulator [Methylicorpusculum sp.]
MPVKAWIHWLDENQEQGSRIHEAVDYLIKNGIELQTPDACLTNCPGVIFTSDMTPAICEQLRHFSCNGQIQVLACCLKSIPTDAAWQLMEAGAADVLSCAEYSKLVNEIMTRLHRWNRVDRMVNSPEVKNTLIGSSPSLKSILRQVVEVAHFSDSPALILGESGTGKELLANLIHTLDSRPGKGNLVVLDCSTIMPGLSGTEFFGHERGAYTGAVSSRDGAFAIANGGTLFLDEVGELPMTLQTQLLRVIQEQTFKRLGSNAWQRTSFRLICATNRDLKAQVQRGEFRADLYYRIAGYVFTLPPLRERPEDILPLACHFLKEQHPDSTPPVLDTPVQEYLLRRDYPGNVRDLKQVIARLLCRYTGQGSITMGCIPPDDRPILTESYQDWRDAGFDRAVRIALRQGIGLKTISQRAKETAIRIAMNETNGNLQRAALLLGVTDRALQMRRAAQRQVQ